MVGFGTSADAAPPQEVVGLTEAQREAVQGIDPELVKLGFAVVQRQKSESFRQAWKNHWRAASWSIFLTSALFMEGYDTAVVNSFFGLPAFLNSFGVVSHKKLVIPANYQSGLTNTAYVGQIIGLFINGYCQERFGSRLTFIWGMGLMTATIFLAVFSVSLNMLLVAELAMGIPWGMFQTLSTAYAAEICPIQLRGYLNAFASIGYGGGSLISSGVLKGTSKLTGSLGWKIPYILQWVWPIPLAAGCFFAPESPWWLVRKGRMEEAERVVKKIARPGFYAENEAAGFVAFIEHTDALQRVEANAGSWKEMFMGVNRRRTEIMMGVWLVQLWNGNIITGLTVELLENAGLTVSGAFTMNLILSAMSLVGVMISWVALGHMGRRTIYLLGIFLIGTPCLLPIGIMGFLPQSKATSNAMGGLMIVINLFFHFSLGPVCYSIAGELPAARLRSRSIVLGRFVYLVSAIIGTQLRARMVAVDAWNWQAKSALFWYGCNLICFTWAFFRLPETGGFSFAELDILFANKVPTRKFKQFKIIDEAVESATPQYDDEDKKAQFEHVEGGITDGNIQSTERQEINDVQQLPGRGIVNI